MEFELDLVGVVVVVAWVVSLLVALLAVPRLAGRKSRTALVEFLTSEESEPLWDKAAERVMVRFEPRLSDVEKRFSQPIQFDMGPVVEEVTERVVAEVDRVRATIDGHLGWMKRIGKETGEAVAELVGEEAMKESGLGREAAIQAKLMGLTLDPKWTKAHPVAAFGLDLLKEEYKGRGGVKVMNSRAGGSEF